MRPDNELELRILNEVSESKSNSSERYSNFHRLGEGGMGVVYRADDNVLDRSVAIKLLLPDRESNEAYLRFQSEARALSKCDSPYLVQILDFGLTKSNRPFIIMEYIEGTALSSIVEEHGPYSSEEAEPLFKQILSGLERAHKNGIIHGDLKPSNVLISKDSDGKLQSKIVDFGLARFSTSADGTGKIFSVTNELVGSPYYMSPEQVKGLKPGIRSDVYSIGCLMFMVLTGEPPFTGETVMDTLSKHLHDEPRVPSDITGGDTRFDRAVLKCLAKSPEDRFVSAGEIVNAIGSAGEGVEPEAPAGQRFNPKLLVGVAGAVLILLLCSVVTFSFSSREKHSSKRNKTIDLAKLEETRFTTKYVKDERRQRNEIRYQPKESGISHVGVPIEDEDVEPLKDFPVQSLQLKGYATVNGSGLQYMLGKKMERLDLSRTGITDENMQYVGQFKDLKALYLADTNISIAGLAKIKGLKQLKSLSIKGCLKLDDKAAEFLAENLPQINDLCVSEVPLHGDSIPKLCQLRRLWHIGLNDIDATPQQWESILTLPLLRQLEADTTDIPPEIVLKLASRRTMESISAKGSPQISLAVKDKALELNRRLILKQGVRLDEE